VSSIRKSAATACLAAGGLIMAGCAASATQSVGLPSDASQPATSPSVVVGSPTVEPSPTPTILRTTEASPPALVRITFQISLDGSVPDDAAIALETTSGGGGGAIYLCSYYGGWDLCESGHTYAEASSFAPGSEVHYRFWRELDLDGASEEIEEGQLTVGQIDQVIAVDYEFVE
jgi:hypothetical protein